MKSQKIRKTTCGLMLIALIFTLSAHTSLAAEQNNNAGASESYNWAGYVAASGSYTSVSGLWVVPNVTSSNEPLSADATWVGIGGINSDDLIQAGTQAIVTNTGTIEYQAWIETLPAASLAIPLTVKPGDTISVSLTEINAASHTWQISFQDVTTAEKYTTNINYTSTYSSAEWIEEMPLNAGTGFIPLDSFGTLQFLNGSTIKNGSPVSIANAGASIMTLINHNHMALAVPSVLTNNGSSFTVARTSAANTNSIIPNSQIVRYHRGRGIWRVVTSSSTTSSGNIQQVVSGIPGVTIQIGTGLPPEIQDFINKMEVWQQQRIASFFQHQLN